MKKIVLIFGAGQVAQVFAELLFDHGYKIAAFVVDPAYMPLARGYQAPVISTEKLTDYPPAGYSFTIGMSFRGLNAPRAGQFAAMRALGYEPLTFIHKRATVDRSAKIGAGSLVMDENTVQPYADIGENVILWSGSHIGHHSRIADNVFVASHAVISGAAEIGERSFIGVNATIRDNVKIGARCVIGAGALILSDCEADGVYSPGGTERSRVPSNRLRGI